MYYTMKHCDSHYVQSISSKGKRKSFQRHPTQKSIGSSSTRSSVHQQNLTSYILKCLLKLVTWITSATVYDQETKKIKNQFLQQITSEILKKSQVSHAIRQNSTNPINIKECLLWQLSFKWSHLTFLHQRPHFRIP